MYRYCTDQATLVVSQFSSVTVLWTWIKSHLLVFQRKSAEVRAQKGHLKRIEDLGAAMEERLILDNRYTEHSTVGLAQQWDQLDQLGMRMQHNLEQQIQARYVGGL